MEKEKEKSLKKLQEELLDLVKTKYYNQDTEIAECVNKINKKYAENLAKAEERKKKKLALGEKIKNVLVSISLKTLQLCDKLIVKEKVSNQIMGYSSQDNLEESEKEIKDGIILWTK